MATSAWLCLTSLRDRTHRYRRARPGTRVNAPAFSLLELLVTIAILAILVSLMLPTLAGARDTARTTRCMSNQRSLVTAWTLYADDHDGRAMPLAYWSAKDVGNAPPIYWWGRVEDHVNHAPGFITPYLDASLGEHTVFECPNQPWGSYVAQGADEPTSTYGYNGYYLSPAHTPGWAYSISHRPWRRLGEIHRPTDLLVFADAMLGVSDPARSTALLDPPMLFSAGDWTPNPYPTTSFRHGADACVSVRADASAATTRADPAWLTQPDLRIGSIGAASDPHYVPDWRDWNAP